MNRFWTTVAVIIASVTPMTSKSQTKSPSEELYDAVLERAKVLDIGNKTRFEISPEVREKFAGLRQLVRDYTQSHSGDDLDSYWSSAFEMVYTTCAMYEWVRFEDTEDVIREAWGILDQAQPKDPDLVGKNAIELIGLCMPSWIATHTKESAALMDEAVHRYVKKGGYAGLMHYVLPLTVEQMRYSIRLAEHERREFYAQRLAFLRAGLVSDMVDFSTRNHIVCDWAIQLYTTGQTDAAGDVLDAWRKMHGDRVLTSKYCYVRFFAAIYGAGGWEVANEMTVLYRRA